VPAFYLKNFANNAGKLWVCDLKEGKTFVSTAEKVATIRDYYSGESARHEDDLEQRLSEIESDAAIQMRRALGGEMNIGPELTRLIAWMAARTEWVRRLYAHYDFKRYLLENFAELCELEMQPTGRNLPFHFHSSSGERVILALNQSRAYLEDSNWTLKCSQDQFLDLVRMQAYLFQKMHFPRFRWVRLAVPEGRSFITSDRPVSWDVLGQGWADFPAALKHPKMDLIFSLGTEVALMAGHDEANMLSSVITPSEFNRRVAARADRFLFGQARAHLEEALALMTKAN